MLGLWLSPHRLLIELARPYWRWWCEEALVSHGLPSRRLCGRREVWFTAVDRAIEHELLRRTDAAGDLRAR